MTPLERAHEFCMELVRRRIRYQMDVVRPEAVMVMVAVPGERWEVEFLDDGTAEIERFRSLGVDGCEDPIALVLAEHE